MGDVIHALPALTDAKAAYPSYIFDWVVEEGFQEIPSWHPAIDQVIPVAIRRWRKNFLKHWVSAEWRQFKTQLRRHHYDLVIDCQGLFKSAWLSKLVKAPNAGFDKESIREPLASWAYHAKYSVSKQQHAVERIRQLFSQALGYTLPQGRGDYGISRHRFTGSSAESANIVFLHATARECKLYPEDYWRDLARRLTAEGYRIRLPWGEAHERDRAVRIANDIAGVEVLPRLNLHGVACVLAQASAVVAVDTGLGHLCGALNVPALTLYGPTDPEQIGAYGENQIHLRANDYSEQPVETNPITALTSVVVCQALKERLLSRAPQP